MTDGVPYDPWRHADALGLRVETAVEMPHDGIWLPRRELILLRAGMGEIRERCVLAHELGHAVHGHVDGGPRNEAIADRYAARRLVDPQRLQDAARSSPDAGRWSLEIGVTMKILGVYLEMAPRGVGLEGTTGRAA